MRIINKFWIFQLKTKKSSSNKATSSTGTLCLCDYLLKTFTTLVFILQFCISGLEIEIWKRILMVQRTFNWTSRAVSLWNSQMWHPQLLHIQRKLHHSTLKMVDLTREEDPVMFLFQHVTNLQALVFLCFLFPRLSGLVPAELFDFSKIWLLLVYLI